MTLSTGLHATGGLYLPTRRPSVVHALPAHVKILAAVLVVAAGVAVPTTTLVGPGSGARWLALGAILGLAVAAVVAARLPWRHVRVRMVVEVPFVIFALALPFVAAGPRVELAGTAVSQLGLVGAGALLLKATTGVLLGITLAATTTPHDLLDGLRTLRLPAILVAIASFMIRYTAVVLADLQRMRTARTARCYAGGRFGHLRYEAAGVGTLFIRSFERGERVHRAMLARGYTGALPARPAQAASGSDWLIGLSLPALAIAASLLGRFW